jgi:hypothetical protein
VREAKRDATVARGGEAMPLEWVTDAAFRFFSTQPDELFGNVLHPDLATNKASAAADRRVPRDIVDLVTIHENILPLGAVVCAAVGKFPGTTPEQMLPKSPDTAASRSRSLCRWRPRSQLTCPACTAVSAA